MVWTWEHTVISLACESPFIFLWFANWKKSRRLGDDAEHSFGLPDFVYLLSCFLLFYFSMQRFPFGTQAQRSLCVLIVAFAVILRAQVD